MDSCLCLKRVDSQVARVAGFYETKDWQMALINPTVLRVVRWINFIHVFVNLQLKRIIHLEDSLLGAFLSICLLQIMSHMQEVKIANILLLLAKQALDLVTSLHLDSCCSVYYPHFKTKLSSYQQALYFLVALIQPLLLGMFYSFTAWRCLVLQLLISALLVKNVLGFLLFKILLVEVLLLQ